MLALPAGSYVLTGSVALATGSAHRGSASCTITPGTGTGAGSSATGYTALGGFSGSHDNAEITVQLAHTVGVESLARLSWSSSYSADVAPISLIATQVSGITGS